MAWVVTAIVGTAVVGAAAGVYSANKAASAQKSASKTASNTELEMFYKGREDTAPWREAGENALNTLVKKVKAGPGEYTESPGYEFRTAEGEKAIERSAAAKGGLFSGRTGKELTRFGQDYATADYQNFLDNYYKSLTPYQSLAGVGQTTASQNAANGNAVAANIAGNTINAGNAAASGYINQANAVTGAANSGVNNYLLWKYLA